MIHWTISSRQLINQIVTQEMHDLMVKPLPEGCRLTAIFDSCHSGSALGMCTVTSTVTISHVLCPDLPYIYSTEGKLKEPNLAAEAGQGLLSAVTSYARGDMGGVFKSAMSLVKTATGSSSKADKISKATRTSPADVVSTTLPSYPEATEYLIPCRSHSVAARILRPVPMRSKPGRRLEQ